MAENQSYNEKNLHLKKKEKKKNNNNSKIWYGQRKSLENHLIMVCGRKRRCKYGREQIILNVGEAGILVQSVYKCATNF